EGDVVAAPERHRAGSDLRPNAPECARDGHDLGTLAKFWNIRRDATTWKEWWAGTGLNRRHQDFQAWAPGRGSARKALLSNHMRAAHAALECAGMRPCGPETGTIWAHPHRVPRALDAVAEATHGPGLDPLTPHAASAA